MLALLLGSLESELKLLGLILCLGFLGLNFGKSGCLFIELILFLDFKSGKLLDLSLTSLLSSIELCLELLCHLLSGEFLSLHCSETSCLLFIFDSLSLSFGCQSSSLLLSCDSSSFLGSRNSGGLLSFDLGSLLQGSLLLGLELSLKACSLLFSCSFLGLESCESRGLLLIFEPISFFEGGDLLSFLGSEHGNLLLRVELLGDQLGR